MEKAIRIQCENCDAILFIRPAKDNPNEFEVETVPPKKTKTEKEDEKITKSAGIGLFGDWFK